MGRVYPLPRPEVGSGGRFRPNGGPFNVLSGCFAWTYGVIRCPESRKYMKNRMFWSKKVTLDALSNEKATSSELPDTMNTIGVSVAVEEWCILYTPIPLQRPLR